MSLEETYKGKSIEFLIGLLENQADYTEDAPSAARAELHRRQVDQDEIRSIARRMLQDKIRMYLDDFDVLNDQLSLPESSILNEEEVKAEFRIVFAQWKANKEDMIPDSWQYVIGAALG